MNKQRPPGWSTEITKLHQHYRTLFNMAKSTGNLQDWENYKASLKSYKSELIRGQYISWTDFFSKMEDKFQASRLIKMLAPAGYINKPND